MTEREREFGIHAGAAETSMLLKLLPDQVRKDRLLCEYPRGLPERSMISMEGALPFAWLTHDLSESGTLGDATAASEELGSELLDSLADGWAKVIAELHAFSPAGDVRRTPRLSYHRSGAKRSSCWSRNKTSCDATGYCLAPLDLLEDGPKLFRCWAKTSCSSSTGKASRQP